MEPFKIKLDKGKLEGICTKSLKCIYAFLSQYCSFKDHEKIIRDTDRFYARKIITLKIVHVLSNW